MVINILGDNKVSIKHILQLDTIDKGSILITANLVILKRENLEPNLTVKIINWRKFIDYFGLSIAADSSRVKKTYIFLYWVYTKTSIYKAPYRKAPSGQIV